VYLISLSTCPQGVELSDWTFGHAAPFHIKRRADISWDGVMVFLELQQMFPWSQFSILREKDWCEETR
jgi:hypothetical protein